MLKVGFDRSSNEVDDVGLETYSTANVYLYNQGSTDVVLNLLEQDVTDDDRTPWTYALFIAKNSNAYHSVRCSNYDAYVTPVNTNTLESFYTDSEYCGPGSYRYTGNTFITCPNFQLGTTYSLMYPSTFEADTPPCSNGNTVEDSQAIYSAPKPQDNTLNGFIEMDRYTYTTANVYVYNEDVDHDLVVNLVGADEGGNTYSAQVKAGEKHTFSTIKSGTYYAYAFPDDICEGCSYDFIENPFYVYPSYNLVYPTLFSLNAPPTHTPTQSPTDSPTFRPTHSPTVSPSSMPTITPTLGPTVHPSFSPTTPAPSYFPTQNPTFDPTSTLNPTLVNYIAGSDDSASNNGLIYGGIGLLFMFLLGGAAYFYFNHIKKQKSNETLQDPLLGSNKANLSENPYALNSAPSAPPSSQSFEERKDFDLTQ
ncbi:MAG: hypothetical protein ACE365_02730 [Gammaproteobacteria bacterium]